MQKTRAKNSHTWALLRHNFFYHSSTLHSLIANDKIQNVSKNSQKLTPRCQILKSLEIRCIAQSLILFVPNYEFLLCRMLTPNSLTYNPNKTDFSDIFHEKTTVFLCYFLSDTSPVWEKNHFIRNKKKDSSTNSFIASFCLFLSP